MIDHIGLRTSQLERLTAFYEAALRPLGWKKLAEFEGGAGFGVEAPVLWLGASRDAQSSVHVAILSTSGEAVDAFYRAAIAAGGRDNGAPGLRTDYHPAYYAAFVVDPDGNNVEAVCHSG